MAKRARRPEVSKLPPPKKHPAASSGPPRGTRAEALDLIFESAERDGEGFRTGALGAPRFGKTYHLKEVVDEAIERGIVDIALIHDVKKPEPQYDGLVMATPDDLRAYLNQHPQENPPVVVFHPERGAMEVVRVEDVAKLARDSGRGGTPTLVLADELFAALKGRQAWDTDPGQKFCTSAWIFREGSSQGISYAWTTQIPQSLPTEPIDISETVAVFHLEGRSADYAVDAFRFPPDAASLLSKLQRGEFLLFSIHHGWNGKIYGPG
jgi:hypothetical protein